ncbi:DNA-processing protein DprA [Marinobacter zhejiangensis]|uniref:DNA protecting protein DprA n=1 Tax=Marinobacter zhejiangensis TaxID=488535 RepID=A0A1I4LSQ1_9GAMM|nr:DNA-processing protein DprA [Marinobacter zhejiangensis]SFL93955.1 DNA protecting protein DprA [Marinobacter zhejiangensis]
MTIPGAEVAGSSLLFTESAAPWLVLAHLPGMGPKRRLALLDYSDGPLAVLAAPPAALKQAGFPATARAVIEAWQQRDLGHPHLQRLNRYLETCRDRDIDLMTWGDSDYPEPLRHIHDAPLVLYLRGNRALLTREQIAIIGSRNASRAGLDHARQFARALSDKGYLVTSGLALGIDGSAHAGALDAGNATVAVIGTGVDVIYPSQHRALTERVIEQGLLVSELPPGSQPRAAHFPQRNRIISGLSRGVLVVEASLRSGSLITARLALEQGREVFAIPGSVHNPQVRGCHALIRQGARLVETVEDIEEELGAWWSLPSPLMPQRKPQTRSSTPAAKHSAPRAEAAVDKPAEALLPAGLDAREIAVLEALGYDPQSTDELCQGTGLSADQLLQSLMLLEMQGLVGDVPGGYVRLS